MTLPIYSHRKSATPAPPGAVSVARGSPWGNPFVVGRDGDRNEVCGKYEVYARERLAREPAWLEGLRGATGLICWCKDRPDSRVRCHAETLARLLEETGTP
jgi:hypothetical protein